MLIVDWKKAWRLRTVQFWALLLALPQALYRLAIEFGDVLPQLSSVVVEYLPPEVRTALAIAGAISMFLRIKAQPKLHVPKDPA